MIQTGSDSLYGDPGRGPWPLRFVECGFFGGGVGSAILAWETMSL